MNDNDEIRYIRLPEVRRRVALGTTKIYEMIKAGEFPAQVQLGARAVAWVESDITEWCRQRLQAARQRNQPQADQGGQPTTASSRAAA